MTELSLRFDFTSRLSELVGRGVPLRKAVRELGNLASSGEKMQALCREIGDGLEEGRTFSSVLASCAAVKFPSWYTAFVGAAEEKDCVGETFAFLSQVMQSQRKSLESFLGAMIYPAIVVVLCFAASLWAACMYPVFFSNDSVAYENGALGSFFLSGIFLLAVVFFSVVMLRAVTQQNPCLSLMHVLAFLTEKGTSLRESLECAVPVVEKNERLCDAVLGIREQLLRGEPLEKAFGEPLEDAGFGSVAKIIASNMSLVQSGGAGNVFERTATVMAQKMDRIRSVVFSCEQPFLLGCAAVYMLILLKNTVMPYLIGGGAGL